MKAIHNKIERKEVSLNQWLDEAKSLEGEDVVQAIQEYKRIALAYPISEKAYNRLMVLFRQENQLKDELYWISKAIENFQKHFQKSKLRSNTRITSLSRKIAHSTGLSDKKGNLLVPPGSIAKWQRRKAAIHKRLNAER